MRRVFEESVSAGVEVVSSDSR